MSKKSRRRNKKILAMLALAGGAALAGRGKGMSGKETVSDAQKAHNFASDAAAVTGTEYPGTNKVVAPISKNKFRTRHMITDSAGNTDIPPQAIYAAKMNAPKGIMHPVYGQPTRTVPRVHNRFNRAKGGRIGAKSGGRVTGIAKRGFGRALMKGKK